MYHILCNDFRVWHNSFYKWPPGIIQKRCSETTLFQWKKKNFGQLIWKKTEMAIKRIETWELNFTKQQHIYISLVDIQGNKKFFLPLIHQGTTKIILFYRQSIHFGFATQETKRFVINPLYIYTASTVVRQGINPDTRLDGNHQIWGIF